MWSAEPLSAARSSARGRCRGHTLVEASIVTVLVALASTVIYGAVSSTEQADKYIQALTTATERGQRTALEIASLVGESRKLFQDDDLGRAYLEALAVQDLPIASGARLPSVEEDYDLDTDEALEPKTGNCLLFVKEIDPSPAVADPLTGKVRHIDTYRFVCVYPHLTTQTLVPGKPRAKDLIVWRSKAFPSFVQIGEIQNTTERANVVKDLYVRHGFRHAWNADGGVTTSFYRLQNDGKMDAAALATMVIPEDRSLSDRSRLAYARAQLARTSTGSFAERRVLTTDDPNSWAPDGFEVKVTGSVRSRKVWFHLVVEVPCAGGQQSAVYPATMITLCQDL
jgi:hypothetical protein